MLQQERFNRESRAGFTSMLDPTNGYVDDTYYATLDSESEQGLSPVSDGWRAAVQEEKNTVIDANLGDIVANEAIDDGVKQMLLRNDHQMVSPEPIPLQVMDDASKVSSSSDTQETVFQRTSLAFQKHAIYSYLAEKQAILDGTRLNDDTNLAVDIANIGLMFTPYVEQAGVSATLAELGESKEAGMALFLMGEGKSHLRSILPNMPVDERIEAMDKIVTAIEKGNSLLGVGHDRAIREQIRVAVMDEDYDLFDRHIDNLISAGDASAATSVFGAAGKGFVEGAKRVFNIGKESSKIRKVDYAQTRSAAQELSPKRAAEAVSDELARDMNRAIVQDTSDTTAKALTGTTRDEAIADAVLPDPAMPDGSIRARVAFDGMNTDEVAAFSRLQEQLNESVVNVYTQKEVESAAAVKTNKLANVTGVTARTEMTQVGMTDKGAEISMVYGTARGGYSNPQRALASVEKALADQGIDASQLTLLSRNTEGEYIPVEDVASAPSRGDYLVKLKYDYDVQMSDITAWDKFSVTGSALGRAARYVLDPASMFNPHLAIGAAGKVDRSSAIQEDLLILGERFNTIIGGVDDVRQVKVMDYLKEANEKGLPLNVQNLKSRGFTDDEVEGIKSFRRFWDMHWHMKNWEDVKNLGAQGFRVIETEGNRLWGRPAGMFSVRKPVYDAQDGTVKFFDSADDIQRAIDNEEIIRLRSPAEIDGRVVEYAHSTTKHRAPEAGNDFVTPYREGYFTRYYTDPYFIVKKIRNSEGEEFEKAIATARSTKDAELYMDRLRDTDPSIDVSMRGNVNNPGERDHLLADVDNSFGRGGQRARGEKLEDASAPVGALEDSHILGPEESMFRSAAAVSKASGMGDFIRAAEQRLLNTYEEFMPRDQGRAIMPQDSKQITGKGKDNTKDVRDARAMYEYIESLKNGYVDTIDDATRGALFGFAETLGQASIKAEKEWASNLLKGAEESLLRVEGFAKPVGMLKSAAFNMYIAMNPLRQFVLNTSQVLQLSAFNPKYMADPRAALDATALWVMRAGGNVPESLIKASKRTREEYNLMFNEYMKSGLPASITSHNMRRSSMTDMARESEWARKSDSAIDKVKGVVAHPFNASRKAGFEMGEEVNLMSGWLAHYDKARSGKAALNASDYQKIAADTRNFTYNMNRAGDMKYNTSALSAALQFAQVPHKAILTAISNKGLTKSQKAKLITMNAAMYGLPVGMTAYVSAAIEDMFGTEVDPVMAQAASDGLLATTFNAAMTSAFEGSTDVSFKNIAPMDAVGVYQTVHGLLDNNLVDTFKDGAGWSAFGAIGDASTSIVKMFSGEKWADGSDTGLKQVGSTLIDLSSGLSNYTRAMVAWDYGTLYGRSGNVRSTDVSKPTAFMAALGFQTREEVTKWNLRKDSAEFKRARKSDLDEILKRTYLELAKANNTGDSPEFIMKAMSHMYSVMDLTADERKYVASQIRQRAGTDQDIISEALKLHKVWGGAKEADKMMLMRATPEQYEKWRASMDAIEQLNKDLLGE